MPTATARIVAASAAILITSVALAAQRSYDKRLDAPPGGRLVFAADAGSVAIVGRDAPEVIIHADMRGSQSFLNRLHISAEQTSSGVMVTARLTHDDWFGWSGWLDWLGSGSSHVRFEVQVPRNYPVDLRTSGGGIDLRGLNAQVDAATSGGGIVIQDIAGAVNAHTSGGSVEAERLKGATRLTSSGGGIEVTDSTGDIFVRTSGGGIRMQNDDGRVDAHTSGGEIRAELRANHGISLDTSGGGITLRLPPNTGGAVDAATSGGRVTSDLPFTTSQIVDGSHLRGTIGGGGPPIYLRTSGGGIHLEQE
jgi:hypothetical protein